MVLCVYVMFIPDDIVNVLHSVCENVHSQLCVDMAL
jgi:hypothetical protein